MNDEFKAEMQLTRMPNQSDSEYVTSEDGENADYSPGTLTAISFQF